LFGNIKTVMSQRKVVGLMSGTSADGIDAALVEITHYGLDTHVNLLAFQTIPYPSQIREDILRASTPTNGKVDLICHLNFLLGELFAQAVYEVCHKGKTNIEEIDMIGSHGQTIHHLPQNRLDHGFEVRSTLQIGESAIIAVRTGITTVADFRTKDIAAGGIGAPLTPYIHFLLFKHPYKTRVVLNIGGIANITLLPAGCDPDKVIAFDTGPGNMLLDAVVSCLSRGEKGFDVDGEAAFQGVINKTLLRQLLCHPYLKKPLPKSTGREEFGDLYFEKVIEMAQQIPVEGDDLIATVASFTVDSIIQSFKDFIAPHFSVDEFIICGGGAQNLFLVNRLQGKISPIRLVPTDDYGIPAKALEAISFAILANEAVSGVSGNLPNVTGACKKVILGKIVPGNRRGRWVEEKI
jgi:anhydro-N-acetylmuramic acid kinase